MAQRADDEPEAVKRVGEVMPGARASKLENPAKVGLALVVLRKHANVHKR